MPSSLPAGRGAPRAHPARRALADWLDGRQDDDRAWVAGLSRGVRVAGAGEAGEPGGIELTPVRLREQRDHRRVGGEYRLKLVGDLRLGRLGGGGGELSEQAGRLLVTEAAPVLRRRLTDRHDVLAPHGEVVERVRG